jgi:glycosyl transferase family 25
MPPPIFIINLPDAAARRDAILSQCRALGLPATLIRAVDGRRLTPQELAASYDPQKAIQAGRELSLSEIGCALSHLQIYKQITEQNIPGTLILEDDAKLGENSPKVLEEIAAKTDPDTPVAVLFSHLKYYILKNSENLECGAKLVFPYAKRDAARTHAYFITRAGAKLLYEKLFPVWKVADDWSCFVNEFQLSLKAVAPYCVGLGELSAESLIETGRSRNKRNNHLPRVLQEYVWKRFLHRLLVLPHVAKKQKQTW